MKKLLLSALLSVLFMGGTYAQLQFVTNTTAGTILKNVNLLDKDTLILNFNTIKTNSSWRPCVLPANLGKDSIFIQKCTTQRGVQAKAYLNGVVTSNYASYSFKCDNHGSGGNPPRVESIDSLKKIMLKSIQSTSIGGSIGQSTYDSITRPAACIFNLAADNQAFGMYPGRTKRIEYVFRLNFSGKTAIDDIKFNIRTFDAGTTAKTAIYSLEVFNSSTFSVANQIGSTVTNFYTTGDPVKEVNLAEIIGVIPSTFTNKTVYISIKTLGTSNSSDIVDGLAHTVDANNVPVATDPIVVFDDFSLTYSAPIFTYPINTATNTNYVNYNNGAPEVKLADAGLTNPGTAIPITTAVSTPINILLKSTSRVGTFTIIENLIHKSEFTYNLATAFMKNDGSGNYNIPVTCTETINATSSLWTLTVAAPATGFVDDDMQFTYNVNKPADGNTTLRLEISNGSARFYYDFNFTASPTTSLDGKAISPIGISTSNTMISVINATQDISIYTLSGQKVALLTANNAMNGVAVKAGAYIIKHGSDIRKVLVK